MYEVVLTADACGAGALADAPLFLCVVNFVITSLALSTAAAIMSAQRPRLDIAPRHEVNTGAITTFVGAINLLMSQDLLSRTYSLAIATLGLLLHFREVQRVVHALQALHKELLSFTTFDTLVQWSVKWTTT